MRRYGGVLSDWLDLSTGVNPWPYPPASALPRFEGETRWHTEGWTGAVLTGERVVDAGAPRQERFVARELRTAVGACRALLAS